MKNINNNLNDLERVLDSLAVRLVQSEYSLKLGQDIKEPQFLAENFKTLLKFNTQAHEIVVKGEEYVSLIKKALENESKGLIKEDLEERIFKIADDFKFNVILVRLGEDKSYICRLDGGKFPEVEFKDQDKNGVLLKAFEFLHEITLIP